MAMTRRPNKPVLWVPTLYFAQGLPYVAVMTIAVTMYKRLGVSNTDIALFTGLLYLPWVLKALWSPFVDIFSTKRRWTISMQWILAFAFASIAFALPGQFFFRFTLAAFWLTAFASATHDIASDGLYMIGLSEHEQSLWVGLRVMCYRLAMVFGQGALIVIAGVIETRTGNIPFAWQCVMATLSIIFLILAIYHSFLLPRSPADKPLDKGSRDIIAEFVDTFISFFRKPQVVTAVAFMLLYRFPEAQLVKLISPFLLDSRDLGGMGLSTSQVGVAYGTTGIVSLLLGGVAGGLLAARDGLARWMKPMAWAMSLTCLTMLYLSYATSSSIFVVNICVAVEQFGYGFGGAAYTLYLMYYAEGKRKTSHYAIATGIMALGMMLPGMAAGKIQEMLGYQGFFWWTIACCALTILVASLLKIDRSYGKKT